MTETSFTTPQIRASLRFSSTVLPTASVVPNSFRATEAATTMADTSPPRSESSNPRPATNCIRNTFQNPGSVSIASTFTALVPSGMETRATVAGTNAVQASTSGNGCTQFFMKAGEQAV